MLKIELANREFDNLPRPRGVFGVGCHSPLTTYDKVIHILNRRNMGGTDRVFLANYGDRELEKTARTLVKRKRAFIIVVPGLSTLRNLMPVLEGTPARALVCEVPLLLNDVHGIRTLDCRTGVSSFIFNPQKLDLQPLVRHLKTAETLQLHLRTFELIPHLIAAVREGKVLDKFNTLGYCESNLQIRNDLQMQMINMLSGELDLDTFDTVVRQDFVAKRRLRTETAQAYLQRLDDLMEFARSDAGRRYREAYSEAHSRYLTGKSPDYAKLAETHKIDVFELKYLVKLWIRLSSERFTVQPLHTLTGKDLNIQSRRPQKKIKSRAKNPEMEDAA